MMSDLLSKFYNKRIPLLSWAFRYYLLNVVLFLLIATRYINHITYTLQGSLSTKTLSLLWAYIITAFASHFIFLAMIPTLLVSIVCIIIWPQRFVVKILACAATSLVTILLLTDTFVYELYHYHINGIILQMVLSGDADELFDLSTKEYVIISALVSILILIQVFFCYLASRFNKNIIKERLLAFVPTIIFLTVLYVLLFISIKIFIFSIVNPRYREITDVARAIPLYYNFIAILTGAPSGADAIAAVDRSKVTYIVQAPEINRTPNYPLQAMQCTPLTKPYNIVIIGIDTWRFDMLNESVAPNIYTFSKKQWTFQNHFSGGNCTAPGVFSLFYSIPPLYWTSFLNAKETPVLIQQLLLQKYKMGIYGSAALTYPAFNKVLFSKIKPLDLTSVGKYAPDRDRTITNKFKKFIATNKSQQPFFSFLFYDSVHANDFPANFKTPFNPWWKHINRFDLNNDFDAAPYLNRYKNAVYYTDGLVGEVLTTLKKNKLLDNTIVIITGDHGEEFNDNHLNFWGHAGNFTHFQIQTPLIIHWPKSQPKVITSKTSHYDIAPYILENALGCKNKISDYSIGSPLFDGLDRPYLIVGSYIDYGIVQDNRITTVYPSGFYQVYDPNYQPLNEEPDTKILRQVFSDMKRFYK